MSIEYAQKKNGKKYTNVEKSMKHKEKQPERKRDKYYKADRKQ